MVHTLTHDWSSLRVIPTTSKFPRQGPLAHDPLEKQGSATAQPTEDTVGRRDREPRVKGDEAP